MGAKYRVKKYKKSAFFYKIAEFLKNVLVVKSLTNKRLFPSYTG